MKSFLLITACAGLLSVVLLSAQAPQNAPPPKGAAASNAASNKAPQVAAKATASPEIAANRALLDKYCVSCHNTRLKTGNLELDKFDLNHLTEHAEVAEKVVRKLRAGMMPPTNLPRPDKAANDALIAWLEKEIGRAHV